MHTSLCRHDSQFLLASQTSSSQFVVFKPSSDLLDFQILRRRQSEYDDRIATGEDRNESWGDLNVSRQRKMSRRPILGFTEIRKTEQDRLRECSSEGLEGLGSQEAKSTQEESRCKNLYQNLILEAPHLMSVGTAECRDAASRFMAEFQKAATEEEEVGYVQQEVDFIVSEEAYQETEVEVCNDDDAEIVSLELQEHFDSRRAATSEGHVDRWCGYWVGPREDDGWGFITASIS